MTSEATGRIARMPFEKTEGKNRVPNVRSEPLLLATIASRHGTLNRPGDATVQLVAIIS